MVEKIQRNGMTEQVKDKAMQREKGMHLGRTIGWEPRRSLSLRAARMWCAWLIMAFGLVIGSSPDTMAGGGAINQQYRHVAANMQKALAGALDPATGELVITGFTVGSDEDYFTIKVKADFSGALWTAAPGDYKSDGVGSDRSKAVVVDSAGNVIVTGYVTNTNNVDFHTVKYDGSTGAVIWERLYNGDFNGNDYPTAIALDYNDNVYVTGYGKGDTSEGGSGEDDFVLVKYSSAGVEQWRKQVNGAADLVDHPLAVDSRGEFVAITGHTTLSGTDSDYLTVVYDLAGNEQWQKTNPDANGLDEAVKVAFDSLGHVIVTGSVTNGIGNLDILTIKYDGANGNVLRSIPYVGADGGTDRPSDLVVDTDDDIYVAGTSYTSNGFDDFYVARYAGDTGNVVWENFFPDPGDPASMNTDVPVSMVVNDTSVTVTGHTHNDLADDDFRTVKFTKDLGHELWSVAFDFAGLTKHDRALFVGLDNDGKLYVAGWSDTAADDYDFYAIEYDPGALATPTGLVATAVSETEIDLVWNDNSTSPNEEQYEIWRRLGSVGGYTLIDTVAADTTSYNDVDQGIGAGLGLESHKRYYYMVRGHNATLEEYSHYSNESYALTTIITPNDSPVWVYTHGGPAAPNLDTATAIAVGPDLDPVVTGYIKTGTSSGYDYYIAKMQRELDGGGNVVTTWDDIYDGGYGDDYSYCITVDSNNDVIVSGQSRMFSDALSGDIYTRKYDGTDGPPAFGNPFIWQNQFDGTGGDDDAVAIDSAINGANDIVVVGHGDNGPDQEIDIVKFDANANGNGTWDWIRTFNTVGDDIPTGVVFDSASNIIVSGWHVVGANKNVFLTKYDINGTFSWGTPGSDEITTTTYSGNGDAVFNDLAVDSADNIYVAGYVTTGGSEDFYLTKYSPAGAELWVGGRTKNGQAGGDDQALHVIVDPNTDEILVSGTLENGAGNHDFYTAKYDADGNLIWEKVFDQPGSDDFARAMGMDPTGNVCIAGSTKASGDTYTDLLAVKYDYDGEILGVLSYDKSGFNEDASSIAVNRYGEAFIAGTTGMPSNQGTDYLVTMCEGEIMQAPSPFKATPFYTTIDFTWANNNEDPTNVFILEQRNGSCPSSGPYVNTHTYASTTTSVSDDLLTPNLTYCYRIQTYNTTSGIGSRWLEQEVTTIDPQPPASLGAAPLNTTRMKLTWQDLVTGEDGFEIQRCVDTEANCLTGDEVQVDANFAAVGTVSAGVKFYNDTTVCPGQVYTYRVRAYKNGDWNHSAWSYIGDKTAGSTEQPTLLDAVAESGGRIELTWNDANDDETGFRIYRCEGACTPTTDHAVAEVRVEDPPPANAVVFLHMDEDAWQPAVDLTDEVADSSGNSYHGEAEGNADTDTVNGRFGAAGIFDGSNSYLTMGDIDALDAAGVFSVELWFKRTADNAGASQNNVHNVLVSQTSSGAVDNLEIGSSGTDLEVYINTASGTVGSRIVKSIEAGITNDTWYHLLLTYDQGAASELKLYLDGQLLAQWDDCGGALASSTTAPLAIGVSRPPVDPDNPLAGDLAADFTGLVDELVVYSAALTADAVEARYYRELSIRTSYSDQDLKPNQLYTYKVAAFKDADSSCSADSEWVSTLSAAASDTTANIQDAGKPSGLTAVKDVIEVSSDINLQWTDNTEFEEQFIVSRCPTASYPCGSPVTFNVPANPGKGGTVNWTDTTACQGNYTYEVKADSTTPVWDTNFSDPAAAQTDAISDPSGLTVDSSVEDEIVLSWTAGTDDETENQVDRCIVGEAGCADWSVKQTFTAGRGVTTYTDPHLTPYKTYKYQVRAHKDGCGWDTGYAGPVTPDTNMTAITLNANGTTSSVALNWNDVASHETGYLLERCNNSSWSCGASPDFSVIVDQDVAAYTDTSVCESSNVTYRVRAVDTGLTNSGGGCWTRKKLVDMTAGFKADSPIQLWVAKDSDMRADYADLRFFDATAKRELPYFIEKYSSTEATVWIKTGANNNIYMYYGNSLATGAENVDAIFSFYDTFAGETIDGAKWTELDTGNTIVQKDGLWLLGGNTSYKALISNDTFSRASGKVFYMSSRPVTGGNYFYSGWGLPQTPVTNSNLNQLVHGTYWSGTYFYTIEKGLQYNPSLNTRYYRDSYDYSTRVELTDTGARYYARGYMYIYDTPGYTLNNAWYMFRENTVNTDASLRAAIHQYDHNAKIYFAAVLDEYVDATIAWGGEIQINSGCPATPEPSDHTWESTVSTPVSVVTSTPVAPVIDLITAVSESELQLDWTDTNPDKTGFKVERCDDYATSGCNADNEFSVVAILDGSAVTYTDRGLIAGKTYYYQVRTYQDGCGWSAASTPPSGKAPAAAPAPANLQAFKNGSSTTEINLSWGSGATTESGYVLERCSGTDCSSGWQVVDRAAPGTTGFTDTGVCPETDYNYRLKTVSERFDIDFDSNGQKLWSVKVPLTIAGFQANYATRLVIPYDPAMQADFDDLRFYDETATAKLDYWLESKVDGVSATVWVRTGTNNDLALYYGNRLAASGSNGDGVFEFFDDFRGTEIDTAKWVELDQRLVKLEPQGNIYQDDGLYLQYLDTSYESLVSLATFSRVQDKLLYVKLRTGDSPVADYMFIGWRRNNTTTSDYGQHSNELYWSNGTFTIYDYNYLTTTPSGITYLRSNVDYEMQVQLNAPSGAKYFIRGDRYTNWYKMADTVNSNQTNLRISFDQNQHAARIDVVYVRDQATPEPVVTLGARTFGTTAWASAYAANSSTANVQTDPPTLATDFQANDISETEIQLNWTDNMTQEAGYIVARCDDVAANCTDPVNDYTEIYTYLNRDDFAAGLDPQFWTQTGTLETSSATTITDGVDGIDLTDPDTGSISRITETAGGALELYTTATGTSVLEATYTGYNKTSLFYSYPGVLANGDFDLRLDFSLPDGEVHCPEYQVYARLGVTFPVGGGTTADSVFIERMNDDANACGSCTNCIPYGKYRAVIKLNDSAQTFTLNTGDLAGTLRIVRSANTITTYVWSDNGWQEVGPHTGTIAAGSVPTAIEISQLAYQGGAIAVKAEVDDLRFTSSGGTYTYVDSGLTTMQWYTYRVYPYNSGTCTNWKNYPADAGQQARPNVPAPTGLDTTNVNTTEVSLTWNDTTSSETGFRVERCDGTCIQTDTFSEVGIAGAGVDGVGTFTDTTAMDGASHPGPYTYRVKAVNNGWPGDSDPSNLKTLTTLAPQKITNVTAAWGSEVRLELAWTDPNDNPDNILIERGDSSCSNWGTPVSLAGDAETYSDTTVPLVNTTYCYRVRAAKNVGDANEWYSAYSDTGAATKATTTVVAPAGLAGVEVDTTWVNLSWVDKTESETGYEIRRCRGEDCTFPADPDAVADQTLTPPSGPVQDETYSFADKNVCADEYYSYQIRAVNTTVPWESAYSTTTITNLQTDVPIAPTDLSLVETYDPLVDDRKIELLWNYDNFDETSFKIERCLGDDCVDFDPDNPHAIVSTIASLDDFDAGIDAGTWTQSGRVMITTATVPPDPAPLNIVHAASGGSVAQISHNAVDGTVRLRTTMNYTAQSGNYYDDYGDNSAKLHLADPGMLGAKDFDVQVDYSLPGGMNSSTVANGDRHVYAGLTVVIADPDGEGPNNPEKSNMVAVERQETTSSIERYVVRMTIDNVDYTTNIVTTDVAGKFRITRTGQTYTGQVWTGGSWNVMMTKVSARAASLAPEAVDLYQLADIRYNATYSVSLTAEFDNFRVNDSSMSYADENLDSSQYYCYRVRAFKDAQACDWNSLYTLKECTLTNPAAPTNLDAAALGSMKIEISWDDNADDETGYLLERKTGFSDRFVEIVTLPANAGTGAITYLHTHAIEPGTEYTYRVRAIRDAVYSAALEDTVTTPALGEAAAGQSGPDDTTCK